MCLCVRDCVCVCLCVRPFGHQCFCSSIHLFLCPFALVSICPYTCLGISGVHCCLFRHLVTFCLSVYLLFPPTPLLSSSLLFSPLLSSSSSSSLILVSPPLHQSRRPGQVFSPEAVRRYADDDVFRSSTNTLTGTSSFRHTWSLCALEITK